MSDVDLKNFLTEIHNHLQSKKGKAYKMYRRKVVDRRSTVFTITTASLENAMRQRIRADFTDVPKAQEDEIIRQLSKSIDTAYVAVEKILVNKADEKDSFIFIPKHTHTPGKSITAVFEQKEDQVRFRQAQATYNQALKTLATQFSNVTNTVLLKSKTYELRDIWELEHEYQKGVSETLVREAIEQGLKLTGGKVEFSDIKKFLEADLKVDISIVRDTLDEKMYVFVGSKEDNAVESQIQRAKKQDFENKVAQRLKQLDSTKLINLPGSDSFLTVRRKKALKTVIKPFQEIGAEVKLTDSIKINKSRKGPVKKSFVPKLSGTSNTKGKLYKSNKPRRLKTGTSIADSPLALIKMLNDRLPEVVLQNMKAPALENRTGRFASSVRVTDIIKTPQGYNSIGYTYDKTPYQVFEVGMGDRRWATVERDPRTLIEKSIRQIAMQAAMSRFYLRRV